MNSKLSTEIKQEALKLGFTKCGIAQAKAVDEWTATQYKQWIAEEKCASMDYMRNNIEKRLDPRMLMDGVKSIVCVALNYAPAQFMPEKEWQLAAYAYGQDYHYIVKNKLRQLAQHFGFHEITPENSTTSNDDAIHYRVFCDSAPILERYWAVQAGLGWMGKHHQLIVPKAGSMFFLGELFLDIELSFDTPMKRHCGNCKACIEACPSGAIQLDSSLDANKCLSYQTIENRGELAEGVAKDMGDMFYGCDRCLRACPWNRFSKPNDTPELQPKTELLEMTRDKWMNLSLENYQKLFKKSAVKRAKYEGLMRNIRAIASLSKNKNKE